MQDPTVEVTHRWSAATKRVVTIGVLVVGGLVLYRFRQVILPLIVAFLLAVILNPIVSFMTRRWRFSRTMATAVVFVLLVLALLGTLAAPVTAVPSIQEAVRTVQVDLTTIIADIGDFFKQPVEIFGYQVDISPLYEELAQSLRSFIGTVAEGTLNLVVYIASGAFWVFFVLLAAFYLVKDAGRIAEAIDRLAPPGYRDDIVRLREEIFRVWNAFLRGQLLLGLTVAVLTTIADLVLGLPYAIALGLLAGALEFLPNIGPILAAVPAVLLALFQGLSWVPLSNFWSAVLVAGVYIVIQQIENNLLVPNILGSTLDLHPLSVLIAIIVGGNLAGILGILFAVPVLGTLRVLASYIFHRLYDEDPFVKRRARQEKERQKAEILSGRLSLRERLGFILWQVYEVVEQGWQITVSWLKRCLEGAARHAVRERREGEESDSTAARQDDAASDQ